MTFIKVAIVGIPSGLLDPYTKIHKRCSSVQPKASSSLACLGAVEPQ